MQMNIEWKIPMNSFKVPRIRFKVFDCVWVENRIADIVKISAGGDVDKVRLKESGKYPVIANALTNKGIVGFYDDYKVKAPAVTVTGRGDVGYAVARHENFTPIVRLLTLQSDNIDVDYLENLINSMRILNESTGVPQLTAPQLGNYKVYHSEIEEQSAIGSLFRTLDDLLASYKDNLANYQSLKATMLSKMFPKSGQTVPEIRLDGFEEDWERKSLSEVCTINSGRDYKHLKNGDIPVYGTGGYMLSVNEKLSDEDAIGIGRKGTIDKPYLLSAPFWTVDTLFYVICKVGYDLNYLFLIFQKIRWKKFDESTGVPSLSKKTIEKVVSKFPSYEEQRAIGLYFSNLDNLINSYQEKITQLETLKKKLLQDMFIYVSYTHNRAHET